MNPDLIAKARAAWPNAQIDDTGYFRYDTGDNTIQDNEDLYYLIQECLCAVGCHIDDPCIEHDCVTGQLQPYP